MDNKIIIKFGEKIGDIELESNTPNLDEFIKFVVENRDKIKIKDIEVNCSNKDFDSKGFQTIIVNSIENFLKKIEINEKQFNEQIEKLKKPIKDD